MVHKFYSYKGLTHHHLGLPSNIQILYHYICTHNGFLFLGSCCCCYEIEIDLGGAGGLFILVSIDSKCFFCMTYTPRNSRIRLVIGFILHLYCLVRCYVMNTIYILNVGSKLMLDYIGVPGR